MTRYFEEMVTCRPGGKFSKVSEAISASLWSTSSRDVLKGLLKKAILCDSVEQFERGLDEVVGP